jgi:Holliday junction resolvasome RuvABC endonuclease subunit
MPIMPRVLGIDPSLTSTGIARIDRDAEGNTWNAEVWTVNSKPVDKSWRGTYTRIATIAAAVEVELDRMPQLVSMEAPAFSRIQGHQHDRAGLWWLIYGACHKRGIPVITPTTNQRMQYATGKGNAQKDHVLAAAIRLWPDVAITGNDTADALILAAIGCRTLNLCIDSVPLSHYGKFIERVAA